MAEIRNQGRVNENVSFIEMTDGRVYYTFPRIYGRWATKTITEDATPQLEIYPDGKRECSIKEEEISTRDLAAALAHWVEF